jgi:anaerobic ribonucleoside-triphosphate reductase activating protein
MSFDQIHIGTIDYNGSLGNGPGVRTLVFLQGCDIRCEGCHNPSTWDSGCGIAYKVKTLADELSARIKNKKITITGGEPFFQREAVIELARLLHGHGFDMCLYTGHNFDEVPKGILPFLKYLKVGKFKQDLRCTNTPYIGSTNQKFITL